MKYEFTGKLIIAGGNAKTVKGDGTEYLTAIMYLRPWRNVIGGRERNVCANAEIAQCHVGCLNTSGRGQQSNVQNWRMGKTIRFWEERERFMLELIDDLRKFQNKCRKLGVKPTVRLNGTSDIRWESVAFIDADGTEYVNIFAAFPDTQFYDYTKDVNRKALPLNYDLTFSYSGVVGFQPFVNKAIENGMRLAVVFRSVAAIPASFKGMPVIGGDNSDIRHLEDKGVVVALYAKGKAKLDMTGFVVDAAKPVFMMQAA